ncbi:MAG TPA: protein kinase [Cyanobacteria bacterium UBA11149]|nr:protein kinase [Cyanobacteria bacterium UBA11367]HBE56344.1 protein kinase [Cyanobacteria bacterium UBA11366]HBK65033.1 protein kinase [Cyanobacteria bacterium UBA11166]HBR76253.1 protein kinase [Cyanobacteria bacterium UBA11159]HBS70488.1 protein kinase [Cyanobacteria bacterium UBA11153]HBW91844.1 protein kinase [Cyanobacteria bacterium UBA11149]HCA94774.1 protein kinase [Cyanobacteria bacterium UBA9226]
MIYCINPDCKNRQNPDDLAKCQTCGTELLIKGKYRLIKPLRQLNPRHYTDVFEVDDAGTRKVLKVLKDKTPRLIEMFEREAFTLQILNHPGIPKVNSDGYFSFIPKNSSQELHCLVMEKIEGDNLEAWLSKNKPISQQQAMNWLKQLIGILDLLHQRRFFHRDIKPSNIILKPNGQLVLIDFGSVREITSTYQGKVAGEMVTTIFSGGYTPPEQLDGKASPESDFFALGRTFVHLMTGKSPVDLPKHPQTGKLIWRDKAPQISQPLADFIDQMMAFQPGNRPRNAGDILPYLTKRGLLIKIALRLVNSPKFKLMVAGLITLVIAGIWLYIPVNARSNHLEGREYLNRGQIDLAREKLENAIALDPNNAVIHSDLGWACQEQKEYDCALKQYQLALKKTSNLETRATIHYNIGGLYEAFGDGNKAIEKYKLAMVDKGEIGATATNDYARLQIKEKRNYALAINLILNTLEQTSLDWHQIANLRSSLYKNLGWAYLQQGDYSSAEKALREAIRLDKEKRAAAYCLVAKTLQDSNPQAALPFWQKCREYDSKNLPEVENWQLDADRYLKD